MNELTQFLLQAGVVAKTVLSILLFLSILSWAIIIEKARLSWRIKRESRKFMRLIQMKIKWNDLYLQSRNFRYSPFARIYRKIYHSIPFRAENRSDPTTVESPQGISDVSTVMSPLFNTALSGEISILEKRMIILSTTVSISPFLGLFGTVWGIMSAFLNMGIKGSADISAVGPGIAEALMTTVAGLAVAIPAVVAYNYFVDKFNRLEKEVESFFINLFINAKQG